MSTPRAEEAAATTESPGPVIEKNKKRRWVSYIWDTFDKSPEERRLLFKLDTAILTFASLGMCIALSSPGPSTDQESSGQDTLSSIWIKSTSIMLSCQV